MCIVVVYYFGETHVMKKFVGFIYIYTILIDKRIYSRNCFFYHLVIEELNLHSAVGKGNCHNPLT